MELIEIKEDHYLDYFEIFSSENVCEYFDIKAFNSIEESKEYISNAIIKHKERKLLRYSIKVNNKILGTICLYSIYAHQKRASIGYALNEKYWKNGIMYDALYQIENIAKNELTINRLQATVLPGNSNSKKLLEKSGYNYEGTLKQYEMWENKGFVDLEMYAKIII